MNRPDPAHRRTDKELAALEKRISAEFQRAAEELEKVISDYFSKLKKRDAQQLDRLEKGKITPEQYTQWRLAQIGRGKRFEALRDRISERMTQANEVAAAYINDSSPGIYSLNRNYAAYTIEQQVGANVGFDLWDEQTVKRLLTERPDLMPYYPPQRAVKRGIDLSWGKGQITAQITSGILQGEPIKKLADRLQSRIPDMTRTSAIRAARTAVTSAQNAGRMEGFAAAEEMGIQLKKRWVATLDGRTRHAHAALDGQTQDQDKPFHSELGVRPLCGAGHRQILPRWRQAGPLGLPGRKRGLAPDPRPAGPALSEARCGGPPDGISWHNGEEAEKWVSPG